MIRPGSFNVRKARKPRKGRPSMRAADKMTDLGDLTAGQVQRRIVAGIKSFKREIAPDKLGKIFDGKDYEKIVDRIPWENLSQKMKDSFNDLVTAGQGASEQAVEALPPQVNKRLRFDSQNPQIDKYLSKRTAILTVETSRDTKDHIRAVVRNAVNRGDTPRDIADQVKSVVGLTSRQAAAVTSYRRGLEQQGLPAKQIRQQADAYAERTLDRRGMMIGITESRFAVNYGQQLVWDEAVDQGHLPATTQKVWMVDADPCPVCAEIDGTMVDVGDVFTLSDEQELQAPPAHPMCKCAVVLDFSQD